MKTALDEIGCDADDVNIQVNAGGVEKARVELSDVLVDIDAIVS